MKALTTTVAKYVFLAPFAIFGLFHFMGADKMAGMVPAWLPGGVAWVYLTGACLIAGPAAVIVGKHAKLACLLMAAMLGGFVLLVHLPSMGSNEMAMVGILKDLGLAGAWLMLAGQQKK